MGRPRGSIKFHSKVFLIIEFTENILIDEDQQLKLIDFGLCAKPKGGMGSVLETCCGSPAYAAPELVTGQNYLGSEADIWSMGVLLYALLCGFLPFDDENISALYRKIQLGRYEKPAWLSNGSIQLLDAMLQTDPKRRITVSQLLTHPWMMDGYDRPVKWQSKYHVEELDEDVVREIASLKMASPKVISCLLKKWDYSSSMTVTYFLLLDRKQRGLPLGRSFNSPNVLTENNANIDNNTPKRNLMYDIAANSIGNSPRGLHNSLEGGLEDIDLLSIGSPGNGEVVQKQIPPPNEVQTNNNGQVFERTKNRASERYHIPNKKKFEVLNEDKENTTPKRNTPGMSNSPLSPSRSVDSGLNNEPKTPRYAQKIARDDWVFATPDRPLGSSGKNNRKVFGSIERGLDKVKNMLTPRKHRLSSSEGPALVTGKGLCNVSTTGHHNPDAVLNDLAKALVAKGIPCQQKGYILRGKIKDASGFAKLSFELEVCRIPNLNVVGIRRKRLKGDAWCYKKVCEEVLRLAAVGKKV